MFLFTLRVHLIHGDLKTKLPKNSNFDEICKYNPEVRLCEGQYHLFTFDNAFRVGNGHDDTRVNTQDLF